MSGDEEEIGKIEEEDDGLKDTIDTEKQWGDEGQPSMEGYFDYKNFMVNPAISKQFPQINRDLQLGNLGKEDYNIVFMHLHLAMDLKRFECLKTAADFIFQRGFAHLVMSNSRDGFQRRLEATSIRVHRLDKGDKDKDRWGRWNK